MIRVMSIPRLASARASGRAFRSSAIDCLTFMIATQLAMGGQVLKASPTRVHIATARHDHVEECIYSGSKEELEIIYDFALIFEQVMLKHDQEIYEIVEPDLKKLPPHADARRSCSLLMGYYRIYKALLTSVGMPDHPIADIKKTNMDALGAIFAKLCWDREESKSVLDAIGVVN